jgi:hypothetical protein
MEDRYGVRAAYLASRQAVFREQVLFFAIFLFPLNLIVCLGKAVTGGPGVPRQLKIPRAPMEPLVERHCRGCLLSVPSGFTSS